MKWKAIAHKYIRYLAFQFPLKDCGFLVLVLYDWQECGFKVLGHYMKTFPFHFTNCGFGVYVLRPATDAYVRWFSSFLLSNLQLSASLRVKASYFGGLKAIKWLHAYRHLLTCGCDQDALTIIILKDSITLSLMKHLIWQFFLFGCKCSCANF